MLEYNVKNTLGHWVCMTARLVERAMNAELEPEGITFRQCQVLAWLAMEGHLAQVELAERMNIEPPTLVSVLDRMQRDGWIERQACPGDRRRNVIVAGPKAQPAWETIVACAQRVQERAAMGLTENQQHDLIDLLVRVQQNFGREAKFERGNACPTALAEEARRS